MARKTISKVAAAPVLPATVFVIVAPTGNIYSGLWYPIVVASISLVIGLISLPPPENVRKTKDRDITHM